MKKISIAKIKNPWRFIVPIETSTRILASDETRVMQNPSRFAILDMNKLVTFIKGEPPTISGRGKKANPVISNIYSALIIRRNEWAHIDIAFTSLKQKASFMSSLIHRATKDNLFVSGRSMFNEKTKTFELWVKVTS